MIRGSVNAAYEAVISFAVQGPSGLTREIEAVIDTGYSEYLTLPTELVSELGLPYVTSDQAVLADGSYASFDVYETTAHWDGEPRRIDAYASDATPLVGMRLLDGHDLHVQVKSGGRVVIEAGE